MLERCDMLWVIHFDVDFCLIHRYFNYIENIFIKNLSQYFARVLQYKTAKILPSTFRKKLEESW